MLYSPGRSFTHLLLPLLLIPVASAAADGQSDKVRDGAPVDLARFADFKDIPSAVVSPDGRTIACVVTQPDLKANRVKTDLWLVPTTKGEPRRLATEAESIDRVLWSPRGNQLAVMGKGARKSPRQEPEAWLWLVDVSAGKSRRLVRLHRSNHYLAHQGADLCWSPDGASLAYLASDPPPPPDDGPIVVSRIQYKTRTALSDNRRTHVWTVEVGSGKARQLTSGRFDEHSIDWSPRGDEIVFCSNRQRDPDASLNNDLFAVKVADGSVRRLTQTAGNEMSPVWSLDGRSLAYTMTRRAVTTIDSVAEDAHVHVFDCDGGQSHEVADGLDRRCTQVRWAADDKSVLFLAGDQGRSLVYRAPAKGGPAAPLFPLDGMVSSFSLSAHSERGACVLSTPTQPAEVWTFHDDGSGFARRTRLNTEALAGWKLVEPREVRFKSFDGTLIQGWLLLPAGASSDNKAALLLSVHGGPHGMYGRSFSASLQLLCARGYAVLYLNPRGSSGYGQRFSDGCVNDWGGGDYKDLMAGVDHALARYPIDADRLGITGGSYGGYMTFWTITQTDRFKAAVPYAGLSNLVSFYGTSLYQDLIHTDFQGHPWDRHDLLWQRSPLCHVKRVKTPTLFLHGEADNDVPIGQSEEMYTALKERGVETVLVRYPREGHGPTEPRFVLDQLERKVAWFDRFLRPEVRTRPQR
jgi:dipeptidyl aminopeptidase/acylaminoacyl peptidase